MATAIQNQGMIIGTFIMAATFYPPDAEAVEKIKALFLAHEFR